MEEQHQCWGSALCICLMKGGVPGCSPAPRQRGSALLPGGTVVQVRWEVGVGSGVFYLFVLIFRHARIGGK